MSMTTLYVANSLADGLEGASVRTDREHEDQPSLQEWSVDLFSSNTPDATSRSGGEA